MRLISKRARTQAGRGREKGYALLEYCAGAAIIAGVLWGALSFLGTSLDGLLRGVGAWAQQRTTEIAQ